MELLFILMPMFLAASASCETDEVDDDLQIDDLDNSNFSDNISLDYINDMYDYIYPENYEWFFITLHAIVFIFGIVGNVFVCLAVYRNHSMRTVTNYSIVNLAVADLLVIIVCLPPTVVWDVTETWFFGLVPCQIVLYLQTVTVTVSVLTLTFISMDRWKAICSPLTFKSTTSRAKRAIIIIWVTAMILEIPELMVLDTIPAEHKVKTVLFTQCAPTWSREYQIALMLFKCICLYAGPLIFMIVLYCQIIRVLWRSDIPGHNLQSRMINTNETNFHPTVGNPEGQLKSRKKAAKMLIAVVFVFAICCFPVHLFSILRSSSDIESTTMIKALSCLAHLLYYANSVINPLIYIFMSGKFRKEFKRTFCCPRRGGSHNRAVYRMAGMSKNNTGRSMQTTCNNFHTRSMHTTINNNNDLRHSTEVIPLSGVCPNAQQSGYHHTKQR